MATLILSAAGAALGSSIGGTFLGVSAAVIGRTIGASVGRMIDQSVLGAGSEAVEMGRIERFRISSAGEGADLPQIYGRMRVAGHVIWATKFQEHVENTNQGGGKGGPPPQRVDEYSYTVSLALALCEGTVTSIGRIWANGAEISPYDLNIRLHSGAQGQDVDPKISAIEGAENTPAFRNTAYVVIEDLDLTPYGNHIPQFNIEVIRGDADAQNAQAIGISHAIKSVALMPGSGEYTLGTQPVYYDKGLGETQPANINTQAGIADINVALDQLRDELANCKSASLIVSWFGDDLRCGKCQLRPKVEQSTTDGDEMPWRVGGLTRGAAQIVPYIDNRPAYGGTPADQTVIDAIKAAQSRGIDVMFYPFILMDQLSGNAKPNPWAQEGEQPQFPWRGRITSDIAPNQPASSDKTAATQAQIDAFFGNAQRGDFAVSNGQVNYSGPNEWSYRRFILHYAHLCAVAGGIESFCIGSEMRGLTQLRNQHNQFAAVEQLIALAADVRSILGSGVKISYAADWSEYFGYHPQDGSHDIYFHLDPLWADENIDFIGIDNYMPLSDWRDGDAHLDAGWGRIYNLEYLTQNVAGGEGYDWYYETAANRDAQKRSAISDLAHGEEWVFRYKDIRNWWENRHYNRPNGARAPQPTQWLPQSKPIRFTELGCGAVDKGTNQPNVFIDPKSSESFTPHYSNGQRDAYVQMQYIRAVHMFWNDGQNNPQSQLYHAPMIDMDHAFVWAWDARPFPAFPRAHDIWSDGVNYAKGHWITGRTATWDLADTVRDICHRAGFTQIDTANLYGYVQGYQCGLGSTARADLQALMLAYGFDAFEKDGTIVFKSRGIGQSYLLDTAQMAVENNPFPVEHMRMPYSEQSGRVRLNYIDADGQFEMAAVQSAFPGAGQSNVSTTDLNLAFAMGEATAVATRWLNETRIARDRIKFSLPLSQSQIDLGDVVALNEKGGQALFRIDQVETGFSRSYDAIRIEQSPYQTAPLVDAPPPSLQNTPITPVFPLFLDLPIVSQNGNTAPFVAVTAGQWGQGAAVYHSRYDGDYQHLAHIRNRAVIGVTQSVLASGPIGIYDRGGQLDLRLASGTLASLSRDAILAGGNVAAIGDGSLDNWEVFQFEQAELIGEGQYRLHNLLRGQLGSDALMPPQWLAGSYFVLLNGAAARLDLPPSLRGIDQYFRIGPAARPNSDHTFQGVVHNYTGNALRPYAPAHLHAQLDGAGDLNISWIRRSRADTDSWGEGDIALNEAFERYQLSVKRGDTVLHQTQVDAPSFTYTAAARIADGAAGALRVEVVQISDSYGAGPAQAVDLVL